MRAGYSVIACSCRHVARDQEIRRLTSKHATHAVLLRLSEFYSNCKTRLQLLICIHLYSLYVPFYLFNSSRKVAMNNKPVSLINRLIEKKNLGLKHEVSPLVSLRPQPVTPYRVNNRQLLLIK